MWSNCVVPIQWKGQVKYLGNIISCDLSDAYDIKANTNVFISQVNTLNNKFSGVTCNVRVWQAITILLLCMVRVPDLGFTHENGSTNEY